MGRITPGLLDLMEIPWEDFPDSEDALGAALGRAGDHLREQGTPYALVLRHGVVLPYGMETPPRACAPDREVPIEGAPGPGAMDPEEALRAAVAGAGGQAALIATTGYTGRALYGLGDRPNQFYMVGSMGCASSLGLGLARAQPGRRVVVLDGDGAVLMRLGALATLGYELPANLIHVVLDNGVHDSTGGQATASGTTDLAGVARACGYPRIVRVGDAAGLAAAVAGGGKELTFVHVRTRPRDARKLPRPEVKPEVVARRFRRWLGGYA
jgi:phosphonopyruvate decarboxylase